MWTSLQAACQFAFAGHLRPCRCLREARCCRIATRAGPSRRLRAGMSIAFQAPKQGVRMTAKSSQSARRQDGRCVRRGGIAFEMILVLVVLLIATIGVVQFGVFLANAQQVALAARVGALEASQT